MTSEDKTTIAKLSAHITECYEWAKVEFGPHFETMMADLSADILIFQGKCKEGTSFAAAAMALSLPDAECDDPRFSKAIKATIMWYIVDQKNGSEV